MKKILIIGGGVIGLSIAYEISKNNRFKVLLVEKNKNFGLEASSKNSEVIHSGVYYKNNSLKANLCVQGKKMIYGFCKKNKISFKNTQKLFIGNSLQDYKLIKQMYKNAKKNDVNDVKIIAERTLKKIEPNIEAKYALLSKSAGIFDVNDFMRKLFTLCKKNGVKFFYNKKISYGYFENQKIYFSNIKKQKFDYVINAAGVGAIGIAEKSFKNTVFPSDKLVTGLYFKTRENLKIRRIIYPAMKPEKNTERVDITPTINNEYIFGPSVEKKGKINLRYSKLKFAKFLKQINSKLDTKKIKYFKKGIRPKIKTNSKSYTDFYIKKVNKYNWINLFGIESPGLTSCLAIAKYVKRNFLR